MVWLLWLAIFVGLPALVAGYEGGVRPQGATALLPLVRAGKIRSITPPVEPVQVYALEREDARTLNAAVPFSRLPNPAARPYLFAGSQVDLARATDCLAAAQIYEAGDDAVGERAVAQVVLNRVRHPAFPKTVCGVVFQGQERRTGCQFTFSCDGALARTPSAAAWERARTIAREMLAGKVYAPVGYATHYHTDWVVPYWSQSLTKIAAVDTHLFFRWQGWWGTPGAFRRSGEAGEPLIGRIARFSLAHAGAPDALMTGAAPFAALPSGAAMLAARPMQAIDQTSVGRNFSVGRLIAIGPGAETFLLELGKGPTPDDWPQLAQTFCAGRAQCRIMAWSDGAAPVGFPLSSAQIEAMAFAYIHNAQSGLQRALWNCTLYPRPVKRECMRVRDPANAPPPVASTRQANPATPIPMLNGVRRKDRFETVKIAPPMPPRPASPPPATN